MQQVPFQQYLFKINHLHLSVKISDRHLPFSTDCTRYGLMLLHVKGQNLNVSFWWETTLPLLSSLSPSVSFPSFIQWQPFPCTSSSWRSTARETKALRLWVFLLSLSCEADNLMCHFEIMKLKSEISAD